MKQRVGRTGVEACGGRLYYLSGVTEWSDTVHPVDSLPRSGASRIESATECTRARPPVPDA